MKKNNLGFTLIELMIVVSITGILSAIAIPAYHTYVIKAQISEGLALSASAKEAVSDYYINHGAWPANNLEAGLADKDDIIGNYTSGVRVVDNVVQIEYGNDARSVIFNEKIFLTASNEDGSISWTCESNGAIEAKYLPGTCQ